MTPAWLILWFPFFAAVIIFFFCLNRPRAAGWVATGALLASFFLSLALLFRFHIPEAPIESVFHWVALPGLVVEFGILINGLSLLMLFVVTGVGSLIFLYSQEYMEKDRGFARYFACLSFFAFAMLGIVLSNNLIQIFIFWELVGLASYLLIGFWFEKPEASDAGKKAFLTTRVGDVGFLLGILLLFGWLQSGGEETFNFLRIENLLSGIHHAESLKGGGWPGPLGPETAPLLTLTGLLIFLGAVGKSAQFPLHVWLPDAMEGPTPVSALIHAATMVAAGVFLLARLFFLFSISPLTMGVIAVTGTVTAFFAATLALAEYDIKRILAYSTLSQLGFMVASLGLGNPQAGMFHLSTHAFFKALLFLSAGSVIHALHTQDIRKVSGLLKTMPVTGWTFLAGLIALVGIFPAAGFWSKEDILMTAYLKNFPIFLTLILTVFLTAIYMGRLFALAFLDRGANRRATADAHAKDPRWTMKLPLLILGAFSLIGGFLPLKSFVPLEHEAHGPFLVTILGLGVGTAGLAFTLYFYTFRPEWVASLARLFKGPRRILEKKYYMDDLYNALIRYVQDGFAGACDLFERHIVVAFCVNGLAASVRSAGDFLRRLQTGRVQLYALVFSLGVTLLAYGFLLWRP